MGGCCNLKEDEECDLSLAQEMQRAQKTRLWTEDRGSRTSQNRAHISQSSRGSQGEKGITEKSQSQISILTDSIKVQAARYRCGPLLRALYTKIIPDTKEDYS